MERIEKEVDSLRKDVDANTAQISDMKHLIGAITDMNANINSILLHIERRDEKIDSFIDYVENNTNAQSKKIDVISDKVFGGE